MKKLVMLLLAVCLIAMCATAVSADAAHSVKTDGNAVTITIGGSIDEEVTLQIKASGGSEPVYVNQTAAESDGAVFQTELAVGEYTYRAYLNDIDEYVEGTFKVEEAVEPPTSEPDDEDPTAPSEDDPTDPSGDDPTSPSDDPSDSTEDTSATDPTEDDSTSGETEGTEGTNPSGDNTPSSSPDKESDENAPDTGDRGLLGPLVMMLVSGSLLVVIIMLKPKAGGKYARKD